MLPNIYSKQEIDRILTCIDSGYSSSNSNSGVFAIRELLIKIPRLTELLFNVKLKSLIQSFKSDNSFFITKAIYFDKPKDSNWFVANHQDLSINVSQKIDSDGFINWTKKHSQIGVQAPEKYLKDLITLRIHLDDTDESNGALYVLPKSHNSGVVRVDSLKLIDSKIPCEVKSGGVMLMKPLTFHSSKKSHGEYRRRVIHLEFRIWKFGITWRNGMERKD